MISSDLRDRIIWLIVFSIAMGFLETAVVVYLRELYYPDGFAFPLTVMNERVAIVELLREAATVIMLLGVGVLAGRTYNQRLAFFIASFAIWDLFYYVFLKLLLGWPESFFTWDILFLIPVPWIGPVLAPCIISVTMLLLAAVLVRKDVASPDLRLNKKEWTYLLIGSSAVVGSWTIDYIQYSQQAGRTISTAISTFVPTHYNWFTFGVGEALLLAAVYLFWRRA